LSTSGSEPSSLASGDPTGPGPGAGDRRTPADGATGGGGGDDSQDDGCAIETAFARIAWAPGEGIASWVDLRSGADLLRADRRHAAFTPVHEATPTGDRSDVCAVRARMGLNRKGEDAVRSAGRLLPGRDAESGPVFAAATLDYDVAGTSIFEVELRAFKPAPRVDVAVRMHKECTWAPENVYLSLPFAPPRPWELWLDKAGAEIRPRIDQIPGTLVDYYAVQGGFAVVGADLGVAVSMLDNHLLQLGPLEWDERRLAGDPALEGDPAHAYAWLMTNYWETNFAAGLGGFYEFRYSITWGAELRDHALALRAVRDGGRGIVCFRLSDVR
jgi:hypothetical protein